MLVVPYARLVALYERDRYWERFGRRLAERLYVKKARREAELLMDSAATRYETSSPSTARSSNGPPTTTWRRTSASRRSVEPLEARAGWP